MSKLNIKFNNADYSIDESEFASVKAEIENHLSSVMNGSGAVIKLGGSSYNIDSTKLTTATNGFVSHLGTISGNGNKVVVNNVAYSIDSTKLTNAVVEIESVLGSWNSGGNGGEEGEVLPYLTFSSPETFTLNVVDNKKYWDGTLEYSTDANTWNEWSGTSVISSSSDGKLYMRGTGNSYITGSSASIGPSAGYWVLNGNNISCNGNIENLLDYNTVANGEHPIMGEYCYSCMFTNCTALTKAPTLPATILGYGCYSHMFYGCSSLTSTPSLPATTLTDSCYYGMFYGCTSLTTAPELPATTLTYYGYSEMFRDCTSLISTPKLPATTLAASCYFCMFYGCTSLTTVSELPANTLVKNCYRNMFTACTNIKISTTQTGQYQTAYRIPTTGTGTTADRALDNMFQNTGGTFKGTPYINKTYYTSNTIV